MRELRRGCPDRRSVPLPEGIRRVLGAGRVANVLSFGRRACRRFCDSGMAERERTADGPLSARQAAIADIGPLPPFPKRIEFREWPGWVVSYRHRALCLAPVHSPVSKHLFEAR